MKYDLAEETTLLARMAALDAAVGPSHDFNPVQGGQIIREHLSTPAGLLIPGAWANMEATPATRAWWQQLFPVEPGVAPGAYL